MPSAGPRLRVGADWRITLLAAVLVPLMIGLGVWQLQRAAEKSALATMFETRQRQDPARLEQLWDAPAATLAYTPVALSGRFLPDVYFLLDNQVRGGQFGYEVLGVLQLEDGERAAIVNRGWIAGDASRQALPAVPVVDGPVAITGHIYVAPGSPFLLAEQHFEAGWPKRIQAVEMDKLTAAIAPLQAGELFRFAVRIDAGQAGALSAQWQVVNVDPRKHQAYAAQWFAMAAVLLGFYLWRGTNLRQLLSGRGRRDE